MKTRAMVITYFTKYLVKFLQEHPTSADKITKLIRSKATGCEILNTYSKVAEDFLLEVINYLVISGRLMKINNTLYPTPLVEKELRSGSDIFYKETKRQRMLA